MPNTLKFNVVLIEPEIPNNTGNIGRICVAACANLHLVGPMGFEITDSRVKRAGLDYWKDLNVQYYDSFNGWYEKVTNPERVFFFSAHGNRSYLDIDFQNGDWLVFGKESKGLGEVLIERFSEQTVNIPFPGKVRSFNLSNAVAMSAGEVLRQFSL
jgi:tRNA (cytidine/uridine-2'-O-)-methyltransferase